MPKIRKYSDQDIIDAVKSSKSIAQVLKKLALKPTGGNYKSMYHQFKRLSLDTSHFTGQGHLKGKTHNWTIKQPMSKILVKNSTYRTTSSLKKRLIKEKILNPSKCSICQEPPVWMGKPIVLILDHINGVNNDHRLQNLRLVCPNCNSQLPTHAGKNKGTYNKIK